MLGKLVHQIKNQDKKNTGYFADGSRRYPVARLRFNVSNGEVRGMSLFALLYPSKTLSDMYLPIESLNNHESLEVIEKSVRLKLKEKLAKSMVIRVTIRKMPGGIILHRCSWMESSMQSIG